MSYLPNFNGLGGFKNNGQAPDHPNGSLAESETDLATLWNKFEQYQQHDLEKTEFMNYLFARVECLTQENETIKAKRNREKDFLMTCQLEKQQSNEIVKHVQRAITDHSFVMVLIDGDGMIFNDELVKYGESGGRMAASGLCTAVQQYIEDVCNNIPRGTRIICRIYANVQGLGNILVRASIIEHLGVFEDFVRGFSRGKTLFDFIDVGAGKDRADDKIIESFKIFSQDLQCARILFGGSHDNGYARVLEECSDNSGIVQKTVLLEGVPFEKELLPLPYCTKKFPGIFRASKIVMRDSGVNARSTVASDVVAPTKSPMTWAFKAAAPAPATKTDAPGYKAFKPEEGISRNRKGQRIDPKTKDFDKAEVDRVKKMKLCNVHFLRDGCPFGSDCSHKHDPKPTEDELTTLRLVARMAPCVNGSGCNDIGCIYGHRCPFPHSRTNNSRGTKSCIFGSECRFPPELHDIDLNVVKTLVIR